MKHRIRFLHNADQHFDPLEFCNRVSELEGNVHHVYTHISGRENYTIDFDDQKLCEQAVTVLKLEYPHALRIG